MKHQKKVFIMILAFALLSSCLIPAVSAKKDKTTCDEGYVNVETYGADGNDKNDDYPAFEKALATGKNLYLPQGDYYISKPLVLSDRICRGAEPGKSKLTGMGSEKMNSIVILEGCSSVYDVSLQYRDEDISGKESRGERVALCLGSKDKPVEEGTVVRSLYIYNIGTAVYSPKDSGCNGALIENIEIKMYTYRGFDMQSENRMMNSYSNLYITSFLENIPATDALKPDCGFALEGSEYGATINQLNVEHDTMNCAIIFKNVRNVNASTIHLEGCNLINDNTGYIFCENTSGYIAALSTYFTYITSKNNSIIRFGDSGANDILTIGIMHNRGLGAPDTSAHSEWIKQMSENGTSKGLNGSDAAKSFTILSRDSMASGNYTVKVKNYTFYTYESYINDRDNYSYFCNDKNLTVTVENR